MNKQENLIKFMYNANLSLMFLYLKHQDISKDYVLSLFEYIKSDKENQEILYKSFIGGLTFISSSSFYNEIVNKVYTLIEEIFYDKKKFEKKIEYFILFKKEKINNNLIKSIFNDFILLDEYSSNEYIDKIVYIIDKVKDKRIKIPLINKLIKYSSDKSDIFKVNLNIHLFFTLKDEKYFDYLYEYFKNNNEIRFVELILEIVKIYNDKEIIERLLNIAINNIINISNNSEEIYNILSNILDILIIKPFLSDLKKLVDKIYVASNNLKDKTYSLKLSISIIILLINNSNFNQGIGLLNRFFSLVYKLDNITTLEVLENIFLSINKINFVYRKNFVNNLNNHIFIFLDNLNDKDLIPIILNSYLSILSKLKLISEIPIFDKVLEIASKIENRDKSNQIINSLINYITSIDEKNLIDILKKSIYISEKDYNNKKLISLLSISYIKPELSQEFFYYVRKELEASIDEEYKLLVIRHFIKILLKLNDLHKFELNIKELLNLKIDNDLIKTEIYINIAEKIINLKDKNIILNIYNVLANKISSIKIEFFKYDYILKLFSFISNFAKDKEFEEILFNIIETIDSFYSVDLKVNIYKSFMLSLLKFGNKYINKINEKIEDSLEKFDYKDYKSELLSTLATSYYRTGNTSKSNKYFNESLDILDLIDNENILFDTILNLLIRLISLDKFSDFNFIIDKIKILFKVIEPEESNFQFLTKILLKIKQLNTIDSKYKEPLFKMIINEIKPEIENTTIFTYASLIGIYNKINDKENEDIYKYSLISFFNERSVNSKNIFPFIQSALTLIKSNNKDEAYNIINKVLESKNNENYNKAIIFLFKELSLLGNLYIDNNLIKKIIPIIKNINFYLLGNIELYSIASSYLYLNMFEDYIYIYKLIDDINIKNRIENEAINILFDREDNTNLINFIDYVLDNSNNLDLLLSYIILLNENKKDIDNIKVF